MSIVTRIKRPTTATPRNLKRGRLVHVSTDYRWVHPLLKSGVPALNAPAQFIKCARGKTYRRTTPKYRYNRESQR